MSQSHILYKQMNKEYIICLKRDAFKIEEVTYKSVPAVKLFYVTLYFMSILA